MTQHSSPLYVYGITDTGDVSLDNNGIDDASVSTFQHRNLWALVSEVSGTEVDRTDENLEAHDRVLRETLDGGGGRSVVPMRFGMVFRDEQTLANVLNGAYPSLRAALNELENTVELGIKVVAPSANGHDNEAIREAAADTLDPISVATTENDLFSDRLLLNRSFLVRHEDRDEFGEAVATFEERIDDRTAVQYTGPWAPYNFVDIEIGAQR